MMQSDPGQHYGQPRAERDDEHHPEPQPVERDRAQKQNERRRTGHEPTTDAKRHKPAPRYLRAIRRQVTVRMRVRMSVMDVGVLTMVGWVVGVSPSWVGVLRVGVLALLSWDIVFRRR